MNPAELAEWVLANRRHPGNPDGLRRVRKFICGNPDCSRPRITAALYSDAEGTLLLRTAGRRLATSVDGRSEPWAGLVRRGDEMPTYQAVADCQTCHWAWILLVKGGAVSNMGRYSQ